MPAHAGWAATATARATDARDRARQAEATRSTRTAMLLFRAGGEGVKAVQLGLIARLEDVARESIESVVRRGTSPSIAAG